MRKEKTIVLDDRGRQLTFKIREMPATKLESFIVRAGLLIAGSGLADRLLDSGKRPDAQMDAAHVMQLAGKMVAKGEGGDLLRALGAVDYEKARPLLDDLLGCCTPADSVAPLTPETVDGIIEDVRTLFTLRKEALALNLDFFAAAGHSGSPQQDGKDPYSRKPQISARSQP